MRSSFFFLPKVKGFYWLFNLGFLVIILWGQGYSSFSIIKKKWLVRAEQAPFGWRVRLLPVVVGSLLGWCLKKCVPFYMVGLHV